MDNVRAERHCTWLQVVDEVYVVSRCNCSPNFDLIDLRVHIPEYNKI